MKNIVYGKHWHKIGNRHRSHTPSHLHHHVLRRRNRCIHW
jgi:hypothetical protein